MENKTLKIVGMTCEHCENAVTSALSVFSGVMDIDVDLKGRTVSFCFDSSSVSLSQICAAIEDEGFHVIESY